MRKLIEKNIGVMMSLGLLLGLVVGKPLAFFQHFVAFGLVVLLFLSLLKSDFSVIARGIKKPAPVLWITFMKMIVLPVVVYFLSFLLPSEFRVAVVLLAATPAAMATPGLLVALKGNVEQGFLVSIFSSLVAPFALPLVLFYTIKSTVELDVKSMMEFLILIIAIPTLAAVALKKFSQKSVELINKNSLLLLTLDLFLFNIGVTAPYQEVLLQNLNLLGVDFLLVVGLSIFFHLLALALTLRKNQATKMTWVIVFAYFNTGLSIVIAQKYFDANTLIITILYELVWNLGMIFMQKWAAHHEANSK